jgi:hypothetical protein
MTQRCCDQNMPRAKQPAHALIIELLLQAGMMIASLRLIESQ